MTLARFEGGPEGCGLGGLDCGRGTRDDEEQVMIAKIEGWLTVHGVRHYFVEGDGRTVSFCGVWTCDLEEHYSARNRGGSYARRCPKCHRQFAEKFYKPIQLVGTASEQ